MADEIYTIPERPEYNPNIRKIQDEDPVSASGILNPVLQQIIENLAALKQELDCGGAVRLERLTVTRPPDKTEYRYLECFEPAGLVVTAQFSDGSSFAAEGYRYPTGPFSTLGAQEVELSYTYGGASQSVRVPVTVSALALAQPVQAEAITYDGGLHSPVWRGFDAAKMIVSGETSASSAGSYTAEFTAAYGYAFPGGAASVQAPWSIGKADCGLSVRPEAVALNASARSAVITVSRRGGGVISAQSSAPGVAAVGTVDQRSGAVPITGGASGTAAITLAVAEEENYLASQRVTVNVTAEFITARTSPAPGVSYTSGAAGLTPDALSRYARAISDNADVTNRTTAVYIDDGAVHRKISVGDTISIPVDGYAFPCRIIGFNHDEIAGSAYGTGTSTGKAGFTFDLGDEVLRGFYNHTYDSQGQEMINDWSQSGLNLALNRDIFRSFQGGWGERIQEVKKYTGAGSFGSGIVYAQSVRLFPLSEAELTGENWNSDRGEGEQYAYYAAGGSITKYLDYETDYWLRSPSKNSMTQYCFVVYDDSDYDTYVAVDTMEKDKYISFAFCI